MTCDNQLQIEIISNKANVLTFRFMPFTNDFVEKMLFTRRFTRQVSVNHCSTCNHGRLIEETYYDDNYRTRYKNLTNDLYFKSIWAIQFKLYEKLGFFPLQYEINKNYIKQLNYTLDFTSKDGWFMIVVDLNK